MKIRTIKLNSPLWKSFLPLHYLPEAPPQLFLLICCWHTGDFTPYSPTTLSSQHILRIDPAPQPCARCMKQIFIITTYWVNNIGSWFMAILLAWLVSLHYEAIKKHERSMHYLPLILKRVHKLPPQCYSLACACFCEHLNWIPLCEEEGLDISASLFMNS